MGSSNIPIHAAAVGAVSHAVVPGATQLLHLPPLPRGGVRADGLTPTQRSALVGAIIAAHIAAGVGLLQVREVREAAREVAPMFVDFIAPPAPPVPPAPRPPPPPPIPQPILKKPPPPVPVIAAAPSPAPAAFIAPAPPPEIAPIAPPAPVAVQASPPAPPAPPPAPKIIPASAVQYLEPPAPEYPRLSRRNAESGRVLVRVFIDVAGAPRQVQLATASGFVRLDEAALAAVRKARFKPYTENGLPTEGWTTIPINFELEH